MIPHGSRLFRAGNVWVTGHPAGQRFKRFRVGDGRRVRALQGQVRRVPVPAQGGQPRADRDLRELQNQGKRTARHRIRAEERGLASRRPHRRNLTGTAPGGQLVATKPVTSPSGKAQRNGSHGPGKRCERCERCKRSRSGSEPRLRVHRSPLVPLGHPVTPLTKRTHGAGQAPTTAATEPAMGTEGPQAAEPFLPRRLAIVLQALEQIAVHRRWAVHAGRRRTRKSYRAVEPPLPGK
jgi:hypothetical protein